MADEDYFVLSKACCGLLFTRLRLRLSTSLCFWVRVDCGLRHCSHTRVSCVFSSLVHRIPWPGQRKLCPFLRSAAAGNHSRLVFHVWRPQGRLVVRFRIGLTSRRCWSQIGCGARVASFLRNLRWQSEDLEGRLREFLNSFSIYVKHHQEEPLQRGCVRYVIV
jgi:hypothetical protein